MNQEFTIDADFPGGNILIEEVKGDEVFLRQDLRDTNGDWFYWAFQVSGAAGRELTFHFMGGDVLGARGPAVSFDEGASWQWVGDEVVSRNAVFNDDEAWQWVGGKVLSRHAVQVSFSYQFSAQHTKALFAFCPLYTRTDLDRFVARADESFLQREILCRSRDGRDVELWRLGNPSAPFRLLLTCRHHACESMASYCLEGMLEAVLAEDELGAWLRAKMEIVAVPFMDKDGVERGDQGKYRKPYDHNCDYGGELSDSIYPEVKALRQWVTSWQVEEKTIVALDLHCPWMRGEADERLFFMEVQNPDICQNMKRFSSTLEAQGTYLPHQQSFDVPLEGNYSATEPTVISACSCAGWVSRLPGVHFAATLEVPYANACGVEVTPRSCRASGRDLMKVLRSYLAEGFPSA